MHMPEKQRNIPTEISTIEEVCEKCRRAERLVKGRVGKIPSVFSVANGSVRYAKPFRQSLLGHAGFTSAPCYKLSYFLLIHGKSLLLSVCL